MSDMAKHKGGLQTKYRRHDTLATLKVWTALWDESSLARILKVKATASLTCHADDKALPLIKAELRHEGAYPQVDVGQAAL